MNQLPGGKSVFVTLVSLAAVLLLFFTAFPQPERTVPFPQPERAVALQSGGIVTGQVVWCSTFYGIAIGSSDAALPGQGAGESSTTAPAEPVPQLFPDTSGGGPGVRPIPVPRPGPRVIPAGAVLVAVQGTALNTRTDESGRFRIENMPVGQYLTVAAGPVRGANEAVASRPNVYIQQSGQSVDLGRLTLGQPCSFGPFPLGAEPAQGSAAEGIPGTVPGSPPTFPEPSEPR